MYSAWLRVRALYTIVRCRLCKSFIDVFPGAWRWQDCALMRSRALADGKMPAKCVPSASDGDKVLARCVPGRFAVARFRRGAFPGGNPWQFFHSMYPKRGLGREKRQFAATYRRRASKTGWLRQDMRAMHPKSPANSRQRIHRAKILPGRGTFRCTGPSNHARRANLAIRRQTVRAIATTAPPLWAAERGSGGFLSGGVTLPKECVVLWGVERWRQSWYQ